MTREKAIEVIKAWDFLDKDEKEAIETLIPELKESEDELISREITEFILTHRIDEPNDIENTNPWLAWLEKQGKSKWSEEDEAMMNNCIGAIHIAGKRVTNSYTAKDKKKMEDWLIRLKQRMQ